VTSISITNDISFSKRFVEEPTLLSYEFETLYHKFIRCMNVEQFASNISVYTASMWMIFNLLLIEWLASNSFLALGVASCCASIQLVLYDAVNRNIVSIR
jgi:hypothetical protein